MSISPIYFLHVNNYTVWPYRVINVVIKSVTKKTIIK